MASKDALRMRRYRAENPEKNLKYQQGWRANNHTKMRGYARKYKYGLTEEAWIALFESQECCCAICKSPSPGTKKDWATDHDHVTKKVRGILCHHCNLMIGMSKDHPDILAAGSEYLKRNLT
jgi:hypothetical protein